MTNHTDVELSLVYEAGKSYNWKRPSCPNGCKKVWGHGFLRRYFERFPNPVWLKRDRCPTCAVVITLLPRGFLPRHQSSVRQIYDALLVKLETFRWPPLVPRQRGGHWLRRFINLVNMDFSGLSPPIVLKDRFEKGQNFFA